MEDKQSQERVKTEGRNRAGTSSPHSGILHSSPQVDCRQARIGREAWAKVQVGEIFGVKKLHITGNRAQRKKDLIDCSWK